MPDIVAALAHLAAMPDQRRLVDRMRTALQVGNEETKSIKMPPLRAPIAPGLELADFDVKASITVVDDQLNRGGALARLAQRQNLGRAAPAGVIITADTMRESVALIDQILRRGQWDDLEPSVC